MRWGWLAVVVALAVAACGGESEPVATVDAESLSAMTLHLPDGPPGATIGNDSSCGVASASDGDTGPFLDLVAEAPGAIEECFVELRGPDALIGSLVMSFPSESLAARAITPEVFADLARFWGPAEPAVAPTSAAGPGDDALSAAAGSDQAAVLGWRAGTLIGAVSVELPDGDIGAAAETARLAAIQHQRMLEPPELPVDIDDDRLAGLEVAPFTPWWVGETFEPAGFPPLSLRRTSSQDGLVDLDYDGVRIQVVDLDAVPPGSEPDQMLAVTTELFDSPCTVTEPIDGPGTAQLVGRFFPDEILDAEPPDDLTAAFVALDSGGCPDDAPNVWMATVDVDGLHVRVNPAMCVHCLTGPSPDLPYRTPEGLRTVVAALVPFER